MYIAQRKRKENIAEYILYLWQLEDLLRALQFSPEAIYSQLVQKSELDEAKKQEVFFWYMDLVNLLRKEGKEENGHLEHTLHLIDDLDNLHKQLLTLPVGEKYRALYAAVAPEIPTLKSKLGKQDISDVELFFRALYAVMLYRIKGDRSKENDIRNVIGLISPAVAELATVFHAVERGETDLFGPKNNPKSADRDPFDRLSRKRPVLRQTTERKSRNRPIRTLSETELPKPMRHPDGQRDGSLIVPVLQPSGIKKPTRDIRIDSSKKWQHQHWQAIVSAYRSSPYFVHYEERFAPFYRRRYDFLVDLNAELQQTVLDLLRMKPRIAYSESYVQNPDPAEDFRDALSPKPRLQRPDPAFRAAPYYQVFTERYPFAANLSIIDLLFCEGPDSTGILRNSTVR